MYAHTDVHMYTCTYICTYVHLLENNTVRPWRQGISKVLRASQTGQPPRQVSLSDRSASQTGSQTGPPSPTGLADSPMTLQDAPKPRPRRPRPPNLAPRPLQNRRQDSPRTLQDRVTSADREYVYMYVYLIEKIATAPLRRLDLWRLKPPPGQVSLPDR